MKGDSITSLMHVWKDDSQFYYWHVTVDDLNKPVDSLVLNYGIENTILGLSSLIQHNRHIENDSSYPIVVKLFSSDLYDHLFTPGNIIPRGWCLISAPITLVEDLSDPIILGMMIRELKRQGRLEKSTSTGQWVLDEQYGTNSAAATLAWAIREGHFQNEPGTISGIIHGQTNHNNGTIEYYFWGWCPDEYDQAGDHSNWSTNTGGVTPPGSSGNTNPPPSPTPEEREEERWNTFNEQYNDPFSRIQFELEFERLFGDLDITFEEFIRMGGLSAFDVTNSGAGGDDTLIDGVVLNDEKLGQIVLNFISANGGFSTENEPYPGLTLAEKALILTNPICALLIRDNAESAFTMTGQLFPTGSHSNDCADAFRHAFFNALNTQSCGSLAAEAFGNAHESEVPPSQINAKNMDLQNNTVGRLFAIANPTATPNELAALICNALSNGQMTMLLDPSDFSSPLVPTSGCSCS